MNKEDITLRRYLLGELSGEVLAQVEKRLLTEDDYFARMEEIEEDLIDSYISGEIREPELTKLKMLFLSVPRMGDEVKLANCLKEKARSDLPLRSPGLVQTGAKPGIWQQSMKSFFQSRLLIPVYAFLAPSIVLAAGIIFLLFYAGPGRELRKQLEEEISRSNRLALELEQERKRRVDLEREFSALRPQQRNEGVPDEPPSTNHAMQVITIMPSATRGSKASPRPTVIIGAGVQEATFNLVLRADESPTYRVQLLTGDSQEIWSANLIKSKTVKSKRAVSFNLPISQLREGDYVFKLAGVTSQGDTQNPTSYFFKAIKQ